MYKSQILSAFCDELERASQHHKPFPTPEHGLTVLRCQLDNLRFAVHRHSPEDASIAAVAIGAMAMRFLLDLPDPSQEVPT